MKILLVKAHSRLGMKYIPFGGESVLNLGVEKGPDAVLSDSFLNTLRVSNTCEVLDYSFSEPEAVSEEEYYSIFSNQTRELTGQILNKLNSDKYDMAVVVGGDHSIALASVVSILKFFKDKKVGLIDFDSHGDIHMVKTSPSGNIHGMWLRPILSDFDESDIFSASGVSLPAEQCLYIGNMILEDEEERFIKEKNIKIIDSEQLSHDSAKAQQEILDFCMEMDAVHVTFDIDVFKKDIVSATGTPNQNGFDEEMIENCIKPILSSNKLFSLDVVEVNPAKENPEMTISTAQRVITRFLSGSNK